MATNQSRTVELKIKLAGVQTLEDLEQVTSDINSELKAIPINSKAFNEMSALAKKANSQIKEIDNNLEGVTSVQKTESLFKLGEGLAGAFAIAQSASLVFGEKTSEQLTEVVTKVGSLVLALDGLKKISEAFSAENIKGLKGIVSGFKESAIGAKLFGASARTALISTGILAFVVALGTVVAYWDEINGFFKDNAEKKATEENISNSKIRLDLLTKIKTEQDKILSAAEKQYAIDKDLNKLNSSREVSEEKRKAILEEQFNSLQEQRKLLTTSLSDELKKVTSIFNSGQKNKELTIESVKQYQLKLEAIEAEIASTVRLQQLGVDEFNRQQSMSSEKYKSNQEDINSKQNQLIILESQSLKENEIYQTQRNIIKSKIEAINLIVGQNEGDKIQLDTLNAQLQALTNREQIRLRELKRAKEQLELDIAEADNMDLFNSKLSVMQDYYVGINSEFSIRKTNMSEELSHIESLMSITQKYSGYWEQLNEDRVNATIVSLELDKEAIELQNEQLNRQNEINASQFDYYDNLIKTLNKKLEEKLTDQERFEITQKIAGAEQSIRDINSGIIDNNASIAVGLNDILSIENQIAKTKATAGFEEGKLLAYAQKKRNEAAIAEDKRFKNIVEKNKEVIQASADLISGVFDLEIAQLERKAELESRKLEEIQKQKEGYAKKNTDLNELLADAEGERYDDILSQIQANDEAIKLSAEAELNSKRIIAEAEWKAAKARKRQAVIDATIQGSLAVIEALPNVLLAVLVGALSAIQIGTILSQPVPEKPNFAGGGVVQPQLGKPSTGDKINAGVNPYEVVLNGEQQANLLFKLANSSGYVSPNGSTNSGIDYDLMADKIGRVLAANPSFVSVAEVTAAQNRLKVVENRASL